MYRQDEADPPKGTPDETGPRVAAAPETESAGAAAPGTGARGVERWAGSRRWAVGALVVVGWGALAGWWTPRGPVSTTQALTSIGVSLAVGFLAGWLTRSRWAMLLGPVLFAATVEVVRADYVGPTVDRPHLSALGLLALLVGRGVHGLLALLPLLVGAAYGAGLARRTSGGSTGRFRRLLGQAGVGLLAAVVVLVAVVVAVPARTAPIAGGVAVLTTVARMGVMIRGNDPGAPVLLFMAGSPGGSEIGPMRRHLSALEQHFVVATVDRRGGGRSYGGLDPTSTLTLEDEVRNTLAVTEYLRTRFRQDKIYLLAHSGGTLQGVLAAQRRPELYRAYVGVAQAVDLTESDQSQYADTLAWARAKGDTALVEQLTELGPPPYDSIHEYAPMLLNEAAPSRTRASSTAAAARPRTSPPTSIRRSTRYGCSAASWTATACSIPGRSWYDALQAPRKELVTFPGAGHRSLFEKPTEFVGLLTRVLAETG